MAAPPPLMSMKTKRTVALRILSPHSRAQIPIFIVSGLVESLRSLWRYETWNVAVGVVEESQPLLEGLEGRQLHRNPLTFKLVPGLLVARLALPGLERIPLAGAPKAPDAVARLEDHHLAGDLLPREQREDGPRRDDEPAVPPGHDLLGIVERAAGPARPTRRVGDPVHEHDDALEGLARLGIHELRLPRPRRLHRSRCRDARRQREDHEENASAPPNAPEEPHQNLSMRQRPSSSTAKRTSNTFTSPASVRVA